LDDFYPFLEIFILFFVKKSNLPPISKNSAITKNPVMDFKQIQELIKIVNKSNIGELRIEDKEFTITIKQKKEQVIQMMGSAVQPSMPMQSLPPAQTTSQESTGNKKTDKSTASTTESHLVAIKSPMIGTFYRKASPDKPDLVEVADDVSPGTIV